MFKSEVQHCGGCVWCWWVSAGVAWPGYFWGWLLISGMFPTVLPWSQVVVVIPTQRETQGLTGCVVRLLDSSTAQEVFTC